MRAETVATNLKIHGISLLGFQESCDPEITDGEVKITEKIYVQVGTFQPYMILNQWQDDDTIKFFGEFKDCASLAKKIKELTKRK